MGAKIINRGRGPEIEGTRITVYDVLDYSIKMRSQPPTNASLSDRRIIRILQRSPQKLRKAAAVLRRVWQR